MGPLSGVTMVNLLCRRARPRRWPSCCTNRRWPARCSPTGSSPADVIRHWSAESGHPIEDLTAEDDFTPLPGWAPAAKTSSDDGLVAEERVLHPALWANAQDGWCRAIAADVLQNGVQASDLDIDRYLKQFLSEKRFSQDPFKDVPKIEEQQPDTRPLDSVRLDAITIGDGVNALKPGAEIDFASGVTVIFGENGSGKSGFVRVLKRAAGVRTAEDILHNVHADTRPTPSATFTVTVGDKGETVTWEPLAKPGRRAFSAVQDGRWCGQASPGGVPAAGVAETSLGEPETWRFMGPSFR